MKYLNNYTEQPTTQALDRARAFFAFNTEQLNEGKKKHKIEEEEKLVNLGSGLITPETTATQLIKDLAEIIKKGIRQDIEENGKEAIIKRELYNHEATYTGEIEDTEDALKDYGFTREEILTEFRELINAEHEADEEADD